MRIPQPPRSAWADGVVDGSVAVDVGEAVMLGGPSFEASLGSFGQESFKLFAKPTGAKLMDDRE